MIYGNDIPQDFEITLFFKSLLNSQYAKDLKSVSTVKNGNDIRYPY